MLIDDNAKGTHCCSSLPTLNSFILQTGARTPAAIKRELLLCFHSNSGHSYTPQCNVARTVRGYVSCVTSSPWYFELSALQPHSSAWRKYHHAPYLLSILLSSGGRYCYHTRLGHVNFVYWAAVVCYSPLIVFLNFLFAFLHLCSVYFPFSSFCFFILSSSSSYYYYYYYYYY